jgi:hypothetical protein
VKNSSSAAAILSILVLQPSLVNGDGQHNQRLFGSAATRLQLGQSVIKGANIPRKYNSLQIIVAEYLLNSISFTTD